VFPEGFLSVGWGCWGSTPFTYVPIPARCVTSKPSCRRRSRNCRRGSTVDVCTATFPVVLLAQAVAGVTDQPVTDVAWVLDVAVVVDVSTIADSDDVSSITDVTFAIAAAGNFTVSVNSTTGVAVTDVMYLHPSHHHLRDVLSMLLLLLSLSSFPVLSTTPALV
jgi:hypothetical protein